jgi:multiphosphoryl transfer protein
MKQLHLIIHDSTGLHSRPAHALVETAKRFQSDIRVGDGEKQVNGKSLISLLTLGVRRGQGISITIEGSDEASAADALEDAICGGLGTALARRGVVPVPALGPLGEPGARPVEGAEPQARRATRSLKRICGVPGAPGIVDGPVHQFRHVEIRVRETSLGAEEEEARLEAALMAAERELAAIRSRMVAGRAGAESKIFAGQADLLRDPELLARVQVNIETGQSAAEAWQAAIDDRARELLDLADEVLAERSGDVRDVGERVLRLLVGLRAPVSSLPEEPFILVSHDLRPSEAAMLDPRRVLGFCTAAGGRYAHTAILARALGIPAVVGAGPRVLDLPDGSDVILDGVAGTLTLAPDAAELTAARSVERQRIAYRAASERTAGNSAVTLDGQQVAVYANVGSLADAAAAAASGAEGIGLLRTEFLFLSRVTPPGEEEQVATYREVIRAVQGRPVTLRALDVGGDKALPYMPLAPEENPFLGERGIRLWRAHRDLFRTQIRAVLRAAAFGPLRIMLPMITDLTEFRAARASIEDLRLALGVQAVEVGIMVEVPSAAVMAPVLASEIDFFSIGTNDLTQYTLAMDRTHPRLAAEADGLHPAVLRLIDGTVRAARAAGRSVSVCGELGADPEAIPILLGLGLTELSVNVPSIPTIKDQIRSLDLSRCRELAERALGCATAAEVRGRASVR